MASLLSRRKIYGAIFSKFGVKMSVYPACFSSKTISFSEIEADSVSDSEPADRPMASSSTQQEERFVRETPPLENGLDLGIYKAILVGQLGQAPMQKKLKGGRTVTLLSLGTGGIRNNRRPFDNEEPKEYANRCAVQWHRVSIYPDRLGELAVKNFVPGSILYVEGNLETKIFNDPITGLVRRIREIAVRRNGRLLFLGSQREPQSQGDLAGVGYY